MKGHRVVLCLLLGVLLWPAGAAASGPSFEGRSLLLGPTLGRSFSHSGLPDRAGTVLGLELSAVETTSGLLWYGVYTDAVYDTAGQARATLGPELGWLIFGVDGGYLVSSGEAGRHGLALRPMLTVAIATVYFRRSWMLDTSDASSEAGLLLKWPLWEE